MKISVLVKKASISKPSDCRYGMSLHIQTKTHSILFDLGRDGEFLDNAYMLGINISQVDTVILPRGCSNYGGALERLYGQNHEARIYVHKTAFGPYCSEIFRRLNNYSRTDQKFKDSERITFIDKYLKLDDSIELFTAADENPAQQTNYQALYPDINAIAGTENPLQTISMVIHENGQDYLFAGSLPENVSDLSAVR